MLAPNHDSSGAADSFDRAAELPDQICRRTHGVSVETAARFSWPKILFRMLRRDHRFRRL